MNTALYYKMFAEQERYREWLLSQKPEEILDHCYEFTSREDILMSLEFQSLPAQEAEAMLKRSEPLADVFREWDRRETSHMDDIWDTLEDCAREAVQKEQQQPIKER